MSKVNALHFKKKKKIKSKYKRLKKAYVVWDDNEISSFSDEEQANLVLMTSHHT